MISRIDSPRRRGGLGLALTFIVFPLVLQAADPGPIAIGMVTATEAVVLQADGRLKLFDTTTAKIGKQTFRVPDGFLAADVAAAPSAHGSIICLTLNARSYQKYATFLLQLMPDGRQAWTWLPERGVYVGVALDAPAGFAYVTNSTTGVIYRVVLGDEKAPVVEVVRLIHAGGLGAIALDSVGQRLFAADAETGRVFVAQIGSSSGGRELTFKGADEIRALAWNPIARRLFIADSGQETVWSVDVDDAQVPVGVKDTAMRDPAGLTVTEKGQVWMVDEGARRVSLLSPSENKVVRSIKWK